MKIRNPNCIVAVNKNRNKGVEKILLDHPDTNIILLDDGFQHRRIRAGLNIIITPFHKSFAKDNLIPLGRLREPASGHERSSIVLISKTPEDATSDQKERIIKSLNLKIHQKAYFHS